tara:strand:- start:283 stop:558 length:276 start_codon:yes stop_codon:yes gene_type:complete
MTTTKTKLPKWFKGDHYSSGDTVRNPFSGEEYELNAEELSMYDFIKGADYTLSMLSHDFSDSRVSNIQNDMRKGLDWFRKHNAKAYMVLLD